MTSKMSESWRMVKIGDGNDDDDDIYGDDVDKRIG